MEKLQNNSTKRCGLKSLIVCANKGGELKMKKIVIALLMCMLLMSGCGSESEEYMKLANEYFIEGQYDYAAYNYVMTLENDRDNEIAYLRLIDSYMELEKFDKALGYLEKAEQKFGTEKLESRRAELEKLYVETLDVNKEKHSTVEVSVVEEKPIPEVTVEPTDTPVVEPTEVPEPTVGSAPEYTFTDIDAIMYVKADVNVRTLPSTDGKKVGNLSKDTKIDVLRQCNETGWYEFEYDGELRYASSKYFSTEKPEVKVISTPVPTNTPTPKPTSKPEPTATATPKPTATSTPVPTNTPKPTATSTPMPTEKPKATNTPIPTPTVTPKPTATPTPVPELVQSEILSDEELAAYGWIAMEEYVNNNCFDIYYGDIKVYGIYQCTDRENASVKCVGFRCAWGEEKYFVAACLYEGEPEDFILIQLQNMVIRDIEGYYIMGIGATAFDSSANFNKNYSYGEELDYYEIKDLYEKYKMEKNYRFLY